MEKSPSSGVQIKTVRVANFRSLVDVEVPLGKLTTLVGSNNAGKTSFLDALFIAIGTGRRQVSQEDIYIGADEAVPPRDRSAYIDILIRPVNEAGETLDVFPAGSFWTNLWGDGISQDDDFNDFVGVRARIYYNLAQDSYTVERYFLKEWRDIDWTNADVKSSAFATHIEPIQLQYIDAKRDLEDDLRRAGSFWRRLTEDLGIADADIEEFENSLSALNAAIVDKSDVLKHLKSHLMDLNRVVSSATSGVDVTPVARRLRDLSKGVDVTFSSDGAQAFPLTRHGMGTRSLASLLVFRAFSSWKGAQAADQGEVIHPLLALEEPEAHLHPQAQRALHDQIASIPGQRLVSTHSPYFAGQVQLDELRLFTKAGGRTSVKTADVSALGREDRRKLRRMVLATRGDLLFSRAVVLFEGETEEQALPIWAETYWSSNIHSLGINFVGVDGDGNYFPFIWLAKNLGLKWFILADGEEASLSKVNSALRRAGLKKHSECENVVWMPNGNNFESQFIEDGYQEELEQSVLKVLGGNGLDDYIEEFHGKKGKKDILRDYKSKGGRDRALIDCISKDKTKYGPIIARIISELKDAERKIPPKVLELFKIVAKELNLQPFSMHVSADPTGAS